MKYKPVSSVNGTSYSGHILELAYFTEKKNSSFDDLVGPVK